MSDFELIEDYLSGKLSAEDKKKFRARLLNDPVFNQEFQELKEIRLHVRQKSRVDIKNLFDEIETNIGKEETTKDQTVMKKAISIAASIVLIAAISYIGLSDFSQPTNESLFDEHFTTYHSLNGQVRGTMEETLTLKDKAFRTYDAGDFFSSEEMLSTLVAAEPSAMNYFYLGMSQLEIGKTEEAIKNLNTVINNYNSFNDQAKWYLALSLLKAEEEDATLGALANIIVNKSDYKAKAEALLKEMGFSMNTEELDNGPVIIVNRKPEDDYTNSPDGSMEMDTRGKRSFQWGVVSNLDGTKNYRFFTDLPIDGLAEGDLTMFVIIEKEGRRRGNIDGRAFVIDKF